MMAMTENDRKYIDDGFEEVKVSVKEDIAQSNKYITALITEKINTVAVMTEINRTDIVNIKAVQNNAAVQSTKINTKLDGHIENHSKEDTKKQSSAPVIAAYIVGGVMLISGILIAAFL